MPSKSSNAAHSRKATARQRTDEQSDPSFATTLAHGMDLLAAFRADESGVTNGELAARTGLSRPTVSRLGGTLVKLGYLRRDAAGRYRLGGRVLAVAYPLLAGLRIRQVARPLMRDFAASAGGVVSIAMPLGLNFIYLETVRATETAPHVPEVGFSAPLASTAIGRALLSLYSKAEFAAYVDEMTAKQPDEWKRLKRNVLASVNSCHTAGYCVALAEWRSEMYGVAAPLYRNSDGDCIAVNCGIPSFRLRADQVESEWGPRMLGLARNIRSLTQTSEPAPNHETAAADQPPPRRRPASGK